MAFRFPACLFVTIGISWLRNHCVTITPHATTISKKKILHKWFEVIEESSEQARNKASTFKTKFEFQEITTKQSNLAGLVRSTTSSDSPECTAARDEWAKVHLRHALRDRYASYEGPRRIWSSPAPRSWWAGSSLFMCSFFVFDS